MTDKPLVTIAIPAYKAKGLADSIASALHQTYTNTEVLIVNDQSPQDVDEVVATFSDPRIRYFTNEVNIGKTDPSHNWNRCLQYARGQWFCLLCDDDCYEPTFVESLLALAERYPQCHVFRSGVTLTDGTGRDIGHHPDSPEWESLDQYIEGVLSGHRRQTIAEFLLHRDTMMQSGGYVNLPYAWGSDYLSIYRFAIDGGIASTTKRLMRYGDSGENLSSDHLHMDVKLEAFRQYINQTRALIDTKFPQRAAQLLPLADRYYQHAARDHMMEADREALRYIVDHRQQLGIHLRTVLKTMFLRLLKRK